MADIGTVAESRWVQLNTDKIKYGNPWDNYSMATERTFGEWMERVIAN